MATTLSLADFRAQFPEFNNLPDAMVTTRIAWAEAETDPGIWGDDRSIGIGFLTAHYCAMTPRGEDMRLQKDKGAPQTFYEMMFQKWVLKKAGGARISALQSELRAIRNSIRS